LDLLPEGYLGMLFCVERAGARQTQKNWGALKT
jgi:hypothetical protein